MSSNNPNLKKTAGNTDASGRKGKTKIDPVKKKHRKINNALIVILLAVSLAAVGVFAYNIIQVAANNTSSTGNTLSSDTGTSMKNDLYTIGNNPTDIEQTYFKELTEAVKEGDQAKISSAVVKCFVSDYYTWTNKDGNYEIGGLQYIYGQKTSAFETYSRWNFYEDLDLYISQYGRKNLLQVKDVTVSDALPTQDFLIETTDPQVTLTCYFVQATWTYESNSKLDTSSFQNEAYFYVVDDEGRMEIVEYYVPEE